MLAQDGQSLDLADLISKYFLFHGEFYQQTSGTPMRSPVVVDIFMESFKVVALESSFYKFYFPYEDDIFMVWRQGKKSL